MGVLALERDAGPETSFPEQRVCQRAHAIAGTHRHEGFAPDLRQSGPTASRERVPVVHNEPQRFPVQGSGGDQPAGNRDRGGQRQVCRTGSQLRQATGPCPLAEVEGRLGMPDAEGADQQRQHCLPEGVLEGHRDPAPCHLRLMPDQVQAGLELAQRSLDMRKERPGRGGQPHAAAVTDQQFGSDDAAGPRDSPADCRLWQSQHFCRRSNVLGPSELGQQRKQRQQLGHLFVLHARRPIFPSFHICY
ncbi:hypothetical protein BJQ89_01045 [Arthrobacter sp. ES1]|nr:hypothetical protein [Arthrobacter sp. ES1]